MNFWMSGPRYDGNLPACDDASALGRISGRFAQKERHVLGLGPRHHRVRPGARDRLAALGSRRDPAALLLRASRSNGAAVNGGLYSIAEDQGFIGASWGVEWCVEGYDRNLAYAPNCKMARP